MYKIGKLLVMLFMMIWLFFGCKHSEFNSLELPVKTIDIAHVSLKERSYYIATPSEAFHSQKSYKLLLAFHGSGQSAMSMQSQSELESASKNYIVVYPQSKVEEWNEGCDCNKPHRLNIDDLGFVEDVVADVKRKYNIIENELYAVGFSQGGLFTQNLMCNSKLRFNGIASVAAPMSVFLAQQCTIEHNTNYLMVHGTSDKVLPFYGLEHPNFGLISSQSALDLIARENNIKSQVKLAETETISTYSFQNDHHINQLIAVKDGKHKWSFDHLDTTGTVLSFFDSVSKNKLDSYSSLYRVNQQRQDVHVRSMGLEHDGTAIILLSGFNKNYHSDSAWFSLLQPLIAKNNRVHVIERFGNGFSSLIENPSYIGFASALDKTISALDEKKIILVSFASGNILAHAWHNSPDSHNTEKLTAMVWIDPDILLPHSIALYQDWPVSWYREVTDGLIKHISQGNWTQKTRDKLIGERMNINALIPVEYREDMDWSYYDLISQPREEIDKQLIRAKEIVNYHDDLAAVLGDSVLTSSPITVIDTDFETGEIAQADAASKRALSLWQQEGSQWSQRLSENSGGEYIPLVDSEHMAVFERPDTIIKAIENLLAK